MKRTENETLMRRVGKWLGVGFRFHRLRGLRVTQGGKSRVCFTAGSGSRPTKTPKYWGFEFWKKVPGNPRNCWSSWDYDRFRRRNAALLEEKGYAVMNDESYRLRRSELMYVDVPKSFTEKDDIIDWILYESDFLLRAGGPAVKSREELELRLEAAFAPEKP